MSHYEIPPTEAVEQEIHDNKIHVDRCISEAESFMSEADVDDVSLARMFIERGYSEQLAYWLVREAEVRYAASRGV